MKEGAFQAEKRRKGKCKGPEIEIRVVCSRSMKKTE
jgi:hypothetical protein